FPEVRMLFFERLGAETIERLAASLGIALEVPVGMFSDNYIHSHLDDGELPAGLSQRAEWCRACLDIYRELRDHTAAETHRYAASDNELEFFNGLQWRIALALKGLSLDSP
ncbi:MAG TPA: hypothetical protein VGX76_00320, partial [Pirellulales bacterium]|nr:hypothetical protein [Pirellulales bacterium]